jgi:hypothetical protein
VVSNLLDDVSKTNKYFKIYYFMLRQEHVCYRVTY